MPRITGAPKVSKVKVGTTVTNQTTRRIKALKSQVPDWIRTPGEAIDYCVSLVMDPSPRLAARLCWLLRKEAERSLGEEEPLRRPGNRFFYEEKVSDSECLRRLSAHFGLFADPEMLRALPNPMRRVDMASGVYVQFPEDWLVINPEEAPESEGAFAVEIDGGPYHPGPHLVYFGGKGRAGEAGRHQGGRRGLA